MADGLFSGWNDNACSDDLYWTEYISILKTQSKKISQLAFENKIPSTTNLKCSENWWAVDANGLIYGEYHTEEIFHDLENESFTNNNLVI